MTLQHLLLSVRARRRLILLLVLVATSLGILATGLASRSYRASSTVIINYKGVDALTGAPVPVQLIPGFIANQLDVITSNRVALKVVDQLQLATSPIFVDRRLAASAPPAALREMIADQLLAKLQVNPAREGNVVEISYRHHDPNVAAAIANGFVSAYQKSAVELKSEPLSHTAHYLEQQMGVLRGHLERAQRNLSQYQEEHNLVALDRRADVEAAKLNDLITQLVNAEAQATEARSRVQSIQGNSSDTPEVVHDVTVQALKTDLAREQAALSGVSNIVTKDHPRYLIAKARVDQLRGALRRQTEAVLKSVRTNTEALERHAGMLRDAVTTQKTTVLRLNQDRNFLVVLEREAAAAQQAYDSTAKRFNEIDLERQSNSSDVAVIDVAQPPGSPLIRNFIRIGIPLSLLGVLLGGVAALVAELRDTRLRCRHDIAQLAQGTALGVFEWPDLPSSASPRPRFAVKGPLRALLKDS